MKTTTKIILLLMLSWSGIFAQSSAPIADFNMSDTLVYASDTVFFTDVSSNTPTTWSWNIQGGTPPSSTIANPFAVFSTPGYYNITLTVSNAYGMDTITKVIHVVEFVTLMCANGTNQTVTYPSGSFYDSGGPFANYGPNENCSILISPGTCVDSITLTFNSFSTDPWYDFIAVYDGTTTSANIILGYGGFSIPQPVTATSGSMLITWISDSGLEPGYHASWQTYYGSGATPVANFSVTPNNVPVLDTVTFTNLSTNNVSNNWDFGDGTTSNLKNPKHAYSLSGTYTVTLIVQSCTSADTVTQTITVQPAPNMQISPNPVNLSMGCNDTMTVPINISNMGSGTLNWSADIQTPMELLVWYYGCDTSNGSSSTYQKTMGAIKQEIPNVSYDSTATTDWTVLQNALIDKNVLLIPELEYASADTIYFMKNVIHDFMMSGGTVVACADYLLQVVDTLDLFDFYPYTPHFTTNLLNVVNTSTPLTDGISTATINGEYLTVSLTTSDPSYVPILKSGSENVCMYRNIGLGKAIYFGFNMESYNADMKKILANAIQWTSNINALNITPNSGSVSSSGTDTAYLTVTSTGLTAGVDTSYIIINSNDPSHLIDTVPVYINMTSDICVDFDTIIGACNGMVQFTDLSINTPTTWNWDFGDGNTSTAQNPIHTYSSNGTYTVKLVASNATSTDSVTKVLNITTGIGPISSMCSVYTVMSCCGYGLTHFELGNINRNSLNANAEGCVDFTCTDSTTLIMGNTYTYSGTSSVWGSQFILAIDTNNDGIIANSEYFVDTIINSVGTFSGTIHIPPNVQTGIPLRLRVFAGADYSIGTGGICNNILYDGQTEDYTVRFAYPQPSITTAFSDSTDYCVSRRYFVPSVDSLFTHLDWDFGDGTTATGSFNQVQNHVYPLPGTYDVQMIAFNLFGNDTVINTYNLGPWNASIDYPAGSYTNAQQIPFSINNGTGINFTSWAWDFGDGATSALAAPSHQYANQGTYYITTLISDTSGCAIRLYDTIGIEPDGITIYSDNDDISVYPIPFSSALNIDFKDIQYADKLKIQLVNTLGQIIYHQDFDGIDLSNDLSITTEVAPGIYNLWIYLDNKKYNVKVMKE